jgi:hypothetical protein
MFPAAKRTIGFWIAWLIGVLALLAGGNAAIAMIGWFANPEKTHYTWGAVGIAIGRWAICFGSSIAAAWLAHRRMRCESLSRLGSPFTYAASTYLALAVTVTITVLWSKPKLDESTHNFDTRRDVSVAFSNPRKFISGNTDYSAEMGTWSDPSTGDKLLLADGYAEYTSAKPSLASPGAPPYPTATGARGTWVSLTPHLWVAGPTGAVAPTLSGGVSYDGKKMWVFDGSSLREFSRVGGD